MTNPKTMTEMAHKHLGMVLMQNSKLMDILKDYTVIRMDDEDFNERLTWCMEHCQHQFRDIRENNNCRTWYFQDSEDATIFAMKWTR